MSNANKSAAVAVYIGKVEDLTRDTKIALLESMGEVLQVWTWRGGEAVVAWRAGAYGEREIYVIARQGLKTGRAQLFYSRSIADYFRMWRALAIRVAARRSLAAV